MRRISHRPSLGVLAANGGNDANAKTNGLVTLQVSADHAIGSWRNVLLVVWRVHTTVEAVLQAHAALARLKREYPQGVCIFQVAETTAKAPDADARAALAKMLAAPDGVVISSSVVYAGTGFFLAAVRALVTGLTMLSRPKFPHLVFATKEEAADWHSQFVRSLVGRGLHKDALLAAVEQLLSAFDSREVGPSSTAATAAR